MSYTIIKAIWPNDRTEDYKELRNSHGSAPVVWDALCQKYYNTKPFAWAIDGTLDLLWSRWHDLSISEHHRSVLMMTFDRVYVIQKDYLRAAKDIRQFLIDFPVDPKYVNHWPYIATLFESNIDVPAIGLWCTSVSDDPFSGSWNEESEEYDPPDWSDCYDLYASIDALKVIV